MLIMARTGGVDGVQAPRARRQSPSTCSATLLIASSGLSRCSAKSQSQSHSKCRSCISQRSADIDVAQASSLALVCHSSHVSLVPALAPSQRGTTRDCSTSRTGTSHLSFQPTRHARPRQRRCDERGASGTSRRPKAVCQLCSAHAPLGRAARLHVRRIATAAELATQRQRPRMACRRHTRRRFFFGTTGSTATTTRSGTGLRLLPRPRRSARPRRSRRIGLSRKAHGANAGRSAKGIPAPRWNAPTTASFT